MQATKYYIGYLFGIKMNDLNYNRQAVPVFLRKQLLNLQKHHVY